MPRRYPKRKGRGAARRATRALHGPVTPDTEPGIDADGRRTELEDDRRRPGTAAAEDGSEPDERIAGTVVEAASGRCWVQVGDEVIVATLPSRLAAHQRERVAVGDSARLTRAEDGAWWVREMAPRRSELARPDPHNRRLRRVIAANVDVVVHVASFKRPALVPALLDRFLIAIDGSGAAPLVAVNKADLVTPTPPVGEIDAPIVHDEPEVAALDAYRRLGLALVICSAETGAGIDALRQRLAGTTAVLAGHSGVGKSSLVNALAGGAMAAVGQVAGRGKGRHTTTRAALLQLADGVRLIDTPGIRELGLWRLELADLERAFPLIAEHARGCRFRDCSHLHEPACAVHAAVDRGDLDPVRLASYHRIRASLADPDAPKLR